MTLDHPKTFARSVGPDFDGLFHWEWTAKCWANPNDKPMDIDGFKERRGHCLFFETKDPGVPLKDGQRWGLEALWRKQDCSVMLIWGKVVPEYGEFWCPNSSQVIQFEGLEQATLLVTRWYRHADGN